MIKTATDKQKLAKYIAYYTYDRLFLYIVIILFAHPKKEANSVIN